jgi:hypothetical protein
MGVAPRPVWGWPNVTPNRGATPNHLHGPWGWPRAKMGVAETTPKSLSHPRLAWASPKAGLVTEKKKNVRVWPRPRAKKKGKNKKLLGFSHPLDQNGLYFFFFFFNIYLKKIIIF